MSHSLEVKTSHREVSDVVRELAPFVDETSVRLPAGRRIADGEWVRFSVHLRDGSPVLEGVGRCQESTQEGASTFRVRLSLLSFDARNEIMFERICLAQDTTSAAATGTIDVKQLRERILKPPPSTPSKSVPPPAPQRLPRKRAAMPPPLRPRPRSAMPPPLRPRPPTGRPPPKTRPPPLIAIPRAPTVPKAPAIPRPSSFPPARASSFPTPPRTPNSAPVSRPPRPAKATPRPAKSTPKPAKTPAARVQQHLLDRPTASSAPAPDVMAKDTSPGLRPPLDATPEGLQSAPVDTVVGQPSDLAEDTHDTPQPGLRLEISARLVERARALAADLPTGVLRPKATRETPEEAVLRSALHLGMAGLAALRNTDDGA